MATLVPVPLKRTGEHLFPRISFFLPSLSGGGAERVVVNLAAHFSDTGHAVDILLTKAEGPYLSTLPRSIRVIDFGRKHTFSTVIPLRRYLRLERPSLIISNLNYANVVALIAHRLARVPTRICIVEQGPFSKMIDESPLLRGACILMLARRIYRWADAIVGVSNGVADDVAREVGLDRNRIRTIYNPATTPDLASRAHEPVDHRWFQPGTRVIMSMGRLNVQKDYPTLLRAFKRLVPERDLRLIILGEGEEREALELLARELGIADYVDLPGFVSNPFAYIAKSSVFVLSSAWEGLPMALVEAMACGTPVVSTDCPFGPSEILEGGHYGRLVPVGDDRALAKAIKETLDSPPEQSSLKEAAMRFSVAKIANEYLHAV